MAVGSTAVAGQSAATNGPGSTVFNGIYVRADFGYAVHDDPEVDEFNDFVGYYTHQWRTPAMSEGWLGSAGVGLRLSPYWRTDVTLERRWGAHVSGEGLQDGDFEVRSTVALANLYLDLAHDSAITPYVGVGLGRSWNEAQDGWIGRNSHRFLFGGEESDVAAALMLGIAADLGHGFELDAGYRLITLGIAIGGDFISGSGDIGQADPRVSDMVGHDFRIGLRYWLP